MNTLFVGSLRGDRCSLHYYSALVRLGSAVYPFDPGYYETSGWWNHLEVRLRRGPTPKKREQVASTLAALCERNRFDLVFVMAENFVSGETLEAIRGSSRIPPVFVYHSHDNNFSEGIQKPADFWKTLTSYDVVFTTKSQNVAKYKALGVKNPIYVPSAYEPSVHRPIAPGEGVQSSQFEIGFVGTYAASRKPYLAAAGWDRLHVWGDGWLRAEEYHTHPSKITARAIYFSELSDVFSRTKISLGLLREEAEDRHTQRTFEIPASGAFQLAPRNDEIQSYFSEGKEIALFGSLEELREKCDYYLRHVSEREKIAAAGYRRCVSSGHSYFERTAQMLTRACEATGRSELGSLLGSSGPRVVSSSRAE